MGRVSRFARCRAGVPNEAACELTQTGDPVDLIEALACRTGPRASLDVDSGGSRSALSPSSPAPEADDPQGSARGGPFDAESVGKQLASPRLGG